MNTIKKIFEYGAILFIIFWLFIVVVDFSNVKKEQGPSFCFHHKIHTYEDGTVEECLGMGYKVFTYQRESIHDLAEMVPSWQMPKESYENIKK